jgi:hypothetical protein
MKKVKVLFTFPCNLNGTGEFITLYLSKIFFQDYRHFLMQSKRHAVLTARTASGRGKEVFGLSVAPP